MVVLVVAVVVVVVLAREKTEASRLAGKLVSVSAKVEVTNQLVAADDARFCSCSCCGYSSQWGADAHHEMIRQRRSVSAASAWG